MEAEMIFNAKWRIHFIWTAYAFADIHLGHL